jgi:hypothetical protein
MPDPEPSTTDPGRPNASPREAVAIGLGFALAMAGLGWWMTRPVEPESGRARFEAAKVAPDYARLVGDRACAACHPGESAAHSRSGHSRTLRLASKIPSARALGGREVADPERAGVSWRFAFEGDQLSAERRDETGVEKFAIEYAFGSRRHAMTFLTLLDRDPAHPRSLEHRLTDFAHADHLDLTPGQKETTHATGLTPRGRELTPSDTLKCFGCHVTATSSRGPEFLDEASMVANVNCERCHGPARDHVEAARRNEPNMPYGPDLAPAESQIRLCGECHRTPEMVTPGDIRVDNPALVRHQPVGLVQSACFAKSQGRLTCATCHDPHARASNDRLAYESTCLSCHSSADQTPCPVQPREGCVGCHMPRRDVGRGMMMSDHWIRVIPPGAEGHRSQAERVIRIPLLFCTPAPDLKFEISDFKSKDGCKD